MLHPKLHRLLTSLLLASVWLASCSAKTATAVDTLPTNHTASPFITLALMGDVMLGRGVRSSPNSFVYIKPEIQSADLALANLESPLTGADAQTPSGYNLCADPKSVSLLADAGFDLLTLANNHHLDCGPDGLQETQQVLGSAGLGTIGPGGEAVTRQVNGIKLGFLAFDGTSADFDLQAAASAVHQLKDGGAIVIVSMHWGAEYQSGVTTRQEEIVQALAGAGAALIWGHHPHVLQKSAWTGKTLVLYSLGNALFDQQGLASTHQSAVIMVQLDAGGVISMQAVPFVIDPVRSRIVEPSEENRDAILYFFK